jgi:hypothetical protein
MSLAQSRQTAIQANQIQLARSSQFAQSHQLQLQQSRQFQLNRVTPFGSVQITQSNMLTVSQNNQLQVAQSSQVSIPQIPQSVLVARANQLAQNNQLLVNRSNQLQVIQSNQTVNPQSLRLLSSTGLSNQTVNPQSLRLLSSTNLRPTPVVTNRFFPLHHHDLDHDHFFWYGTSFYPGYVPAFAISQSYVPRYYGGYPSYVPSYSGYPSYSGGYSPSYGSGGYSPSYGGGGSYPNYGSSYPNYGNNAQNGLLYYGDTGTPGGGKGTSYGGDYSSNKNQNQPDTKTKTTPTQSSLTSPDTGKVLTALGVPNNDGQLAYPLGLQVLQPAAENTKLLDQIETLLQLAVSQEIKGQVNANVILEASAAVDRLQTMLKGRQSNMMANNYQEAQQYIDKLRHALKDLQPKA